MIKVVRLWAEAWGDDTEFWTERQFGTRACTWLDDVLTNDTSAPEYLSGREDVLAHALDVMIRSGCTNAHGLEARLKTGHLPATS